VFIAGVVMFGSRGEEEEGGQGEDRGGDQGGDQEGEQGEGQDEGREEEDLAEE